jgi:hypothetical protein
MGHMEDAIKHLTQTVESLEGRIKALENPGQKAPLTTEEVRMILIGPPGAGQFLPLRPGRMPRSSSRTTLLAEVSGR